MVTECGMILLAFRKAITEKPKHVTHWEMTVLRMSAFLEQWVRNDLRCARDFKYQAHCFSACIIEKLGGPGNTVFCQWVRFSASFRSGRTLFKLTNSPFRTGRTLFKLTSLINAPFKTGRTLFKLTSFNKPLLELAVLRLNWPVLITPFQNWLYFI